MATDAQPTVREAAEAIARESGKDLLAALMRDLFDEGIVLHSERRGRPVARLTVEDGAVAVDLLERPPRLLNRVAEAMEHVDAPETPFPAWRWVVKLQGSAVGEFGRGAEEPGIDARRATLALVKSLGMSTRRQG